MQGGVRAQKQTPITPDAPDAKSYSARPWSGYKGVGLFGDFFRGDRLAVSRNCSVVIIIFQRTINHINYHAVNLDIAPGLEQLQGSILGPQHRVDVPFLENLFEQ
jgi:hypothetical protein